MPWPAPAANWPDSIFALDPGDRRVQTGAVIHIRSPSVAGFFYPDDPRSLEGEVHRFLADAERARGEPPLSPKALIVPHAGYRYSGPIAASAYQHLAARRREIKRVILLGPSHRAPLTGLGASSAEAFETPLGRVRLDQQAVQQVLQLPQVSIDDDAHADEHSLEVQLPFLQTLLEDFALVPFSVGDATGEDVAELLEELWGGDETLVVISSDLSHYHAYREAQARDAETTRAIEALQPEPLDWESACGRVPIRGLLLTAKRKNLAVHTLDVRNSGDTQGGRDRVVGYGAWAFVDSASAQRDEYDPEERKSLLDLARHSIEFSATHGAPATVSLNDYPSKLIATRACFVTLRTSGDLRGCIGSVEASRPLVIDVADRAFAAANRDPRFSPVRANELENLEISISVLSPLESLTVASQEELLNQLRPEIDGLIVQEVTSRGVFLPAVWAQLPNPRDFLRQLKKKAALGEDYWSNSLQFWKFETETFGDRDRE